MSFSRRLLHLGAPILDATGLAAGFGRPHKGVGEIVVSHAVTTDKRNVLFDEMYTAAPFLEALIRHYQSRGADIVSMDEALRRLSEGSDRYFVVFTFDDGYRDNLTRALPIFERLGLPFTVYVTTSFIDRSFPIWWGALREVIKNADRLSIDVFGLEIHAVSVNEKIRAYNKIIAMAEKTPGGPDAVMDFCRKKGVTTEDILNKEALSEKELVQLSRSPLVEIGGHTTSHQHLSQLSETAVRMEMIDNKSYLQNATGRAVEHFAFPYGGRRSNGARESEIAREAGFRSAVTTRLGALFPGHAQHLTALPRHRLYESLGIINCQTSGLLSRLANRNKRPPILH